MLRAVGMPKPYGEEVTMYVVGNYRVTSEEPGTVTFPARASRALSRNDWGKPTHLTATWPWQQLRRMLPSIFPM